MKYRPHGPLCRTAHSIMSLRGWYESVHPRQKLQFFITLSWKWHTIASFFFFFFKFIYFNWRLITLQYCSGFCHTLTWISHRCTCVPHPETPSHLPPHPIPLGHPSAPALSTLSHALNLDWRSISYMIIYMFQCCSSNHPTLAFSHRVQKPIIYVCVSLNFFIYLFLVPKTFSIGV